MRRHNHWWGATAALAAAVVVMAGCSGGSSRFPGSSGAPKHPVPTTGGSSPALPSLAGQSFNVLGGWSGDQEAAFHAVLSAFDKETGAKGSYSVAVGGDVATVLATQLAAGRSPDIALLSAPSAVDSYAKAGSIQPASLAVQNALQAHYSGQWADFGSYGGTRYAVPVDAVDESSVWYNTALFKRAGIASPPSTWNQLLGDARRLAGAGISVPVAIGGADGAILTDWFENVYLRTAGLAAYEQLAQHQIPWTDPTVTVALGDLKQLFGDSSLVGLPAEAAKASFAASVDATFSRKPSSAIVYGGSDVVATIAADRDRSALGSGAKWFPFPSIDGSEPAVEVSADFAVAFTKNSAAQEFLQYLASPAAADLLVGTPGADLLSPDKDVAASAYPDTTLASLAEQVAGMDGGLAYDMSKEAPPAFGDTAGQGEWASLQSFLQAGDVAATEQQLEAAAHDVAWTTS